MMDIRTSSQRRRVADEGGPISRQESDNSTEVIPRSVRQLREANLVPTLLRDQSGNLFSPQDPSLARNYALRRAAEAFRSRAAREDFFSVTCPITLGPCELPVQLSDGHTYDLSAVLSLRPRNLGLGMTVPSPVTRAPLAYPLAWSMDDRVLDLSMYGYLVTEGRFSSMPPFDSGRLTTTVNWRDTRLSPALVLEDPELFRAILTREIHFETGGKFALFSLLSFAVGEYLLKPSLRTIGQYESCLAMAFSEVTRPARAAALSLCAPYQNAYLEQLKADAVREARLSWSRAWASIMLTIGLFLFIRGQFFLSSALMLRRSVHRSVFCGGVTDESLNTVRNASQQRAARALQDDLAALHASPKGGSRGH